MQISHTKNIPYIMNEDLLKLKPEGFWRNFRSLTLIPRPSKHETAAVNFLLDFAKHKSIEAFKDQAGNVIMRKPASKGMEHITGIILQAHIDMVPQKTADKVHDFEKDPITTVIKDGYVWADNTTLGADDGAGVAAIMSVFEDNSLVHGPLEALITVDEETGMTGAQGLQPGILKGKIMLNLDSEAENIFFIGCAGGVNAETTMPMNFVPINVNDYQAYIIKLSGYRGGHSGDDIIKNRPNAIKLLFRFIYDNQNIGFKTGKFSGGSLRNAIPREAQAELYVEKSKMHEFETAVARYREIYFSEYGKSDPDSKFEFEKVDGDAKVLDDSSFKNALFLINALPSGVFSMCADIDALVETSNNLAIVNCCVDKLETHSLIRSSVMSQQEYLKNLFKNICDFAGAELTFSGEYPGWKPNPDSAILKIAAQCNKRVMNVEPVARAIHAGLECGLISGKYPDLDMISMGPDMIAIHTPEERINIDSAARFMNLLIEILRSVNV